jgi:hypothetical protein
MTQAVFSYQRIKARRNKLFNSALRPYIDAHIVGTVVYDMSKDILAELPDTVARTAVFDSIRAIAGTILTSPAAGQFAWRLAGNVDKLIDGVPVLPWTRQIADELVPVCVEQVQPYFRKNNSGQLLHCRAIAGTPCPMSFTQFLSDGNCRAISRSLGFSAPWGQYPYSSPAQFVNLLFFAHIEAARSGEKPYFSKVSASGSMVKANRHLLEVRCRAVPCPQGYDHPCANCHVGHDVCEYAVHPRTYEPRHCDSCNTTGFFDPEDNSLMCVRCCAAAGRREITR